MICSVQAENRQDKRTCKLTISVRDFSFKVRPVKNCHFTDTKLLQMSTQDIKMRMPSFKRHVRALIIYNAKSTLYNSRFINNHLSRYLNDVFSKSQKSISSLKN